MDPLSALGIAAAAVQFFDFAFRALKGCTDVCRSGKGVDLKVIERTTKDLVDLKESLSHQTKVMLSEEGGATMLVEQEKALQDLYSDCQLAAVDLISTLEKIKTKSGQAKSKWTNFREAFLSVWKEKQILAMEETISTYQKQLVIRLLEYLSLKTDLYAVHNEKQLRKLDANDAEIIKVIGFTQDKLLSETRRNHQEVVSALFTLANGDTRTMTIPERISSDPLPRSEVGTTDLTRTQKVLTFERGQEIVKTEARPIQRAVLDCLEFRQIRDRFDTAKDRHRNTLEWIYRDPAEANKPWSNFQEWLSSQDQQIFWINGKPGSGKTTLMKFISQDPRTLEGLRAWASDGQLAFASFFFWNLGPFELQKSQAGLLRSLLHDSLSKTPSLIPIVMPELCLDIVKAQENLKSSSREPFFDNIFQTAQVGEPTVPELIRWFRRLLQRANAKLRFCFLIDGLDEFAGDLNELIDLILSESKACPWMKFILASRPIIPCTEAFSCFPNLRLQDLNYDDIRQYAADMLKPKLKLLGDDSAPGNSSLLEQLTEKSSGVFLWVVLVAKSIIQGLENGDRLPELQDCLKQLPSDLAELYQQMFAKISVPYRRQASKLFRILLQGLEYEATRGETYPNTALFYSYVEHSWNETDRAPIEELTPRAVTRRREEIDRRLRSRCCGLVEINQRAIPNPIFDHWHRRTDSYFFVPGGSLGGDMRLHPRRASSYETAVLSQVASTHTKSPNAADSNKEPSKVPCVEFIHRSVVEFLRDPAVSAILLRDTQDSEDEPHHSLLWAHILWLKCAPRGQFFGLENACRDGYHFHAIMRTALHDMEEAEACSRPFPSKYLDELDRVLQSHWETALFCPHICVPVNVFTPTKGHWARALIFLALPSGSSRLEMYERADRGEGPRASQDHTKYVPTLSGISQMLLEQIDRLGFAYVAAVLNLRSYIENKAQPKSKKDSHKSQAHTKLLSARIRHRSEFYHLEYITPTRARFWGEDNPIDGTAKPPYANIESWSFVDSIRYLLYNGADPNYCAEGERESAWIKYLGTTPLLKKMPTSDPSAFQDTLRLFVSHGANLSDPLKIEIPPEEELLKSPTTIHMAQMNWLEDILQVNLDTPRQRSKWQPRIFTALTFLEFLSA